MRQVVDVLLRAPSRAQAHAVLGNGAPERAIRAREGPASFENDMADLNNVKKALGRMLSQESYERARKKIQQKYGKQS